MFQNYILFNNYNSGFFINRNAKIVLMKINSFVRVTKIFQIVLRGGGDENLGRSNVDNSNLFQS